MQISFKTALIATLAVASLAFAAPVANASPAQTSQAVAAAPIQLTAPDSGPVRLVDSISKLPLGATSYPIGSGSYVTIAPLPQSGGMTPMFNVGVGWGVYVYLDRIDQAAIVSGDAAGLAILICAIPAVNVYGCAAVTTVLVGAAVYISAHGICPSKLEIKMPTGSRKCVS